MAGVTQQKERAYAVHGQVVRSHCIPWALADLYSLLRDYSIRSVPDTLRLRVEGHTANIKCVDFIGADESVYAVSGSRWV